MKLPIEVEKKLDIIKSKGLLVGVAFSPSKMAYQIIIDKDKQEFDNDKDFYKYIDKKLKEVLNDKNN